MATKNNIITAVKVDDEDFEIFNECMEMLKNKLEYQGKEVSKANVIVEALHSLYKDLKNEDQTINREQSLFIEQIRDVVNTEMRSVIKALSNISERADTGVIMLDAFMNRACGSIDKEAEDFYKKDQTTGQNQFSSIEDCKRMFHDMIYPELVTNGSSRLNEIRKIRLSLLEEDK